jgi:hypothetical protein
MDCSLFPSLHLLIIVLLRAKSEKEKKSKIFTVQVPTKDENLSLYIYNRGQQPCEGIPDLIRSNPFIIPFIIHYSFFIFSLSLYLVINDKTAFDALPVSVSLHTYIHTKSGGN